jgi:hypothetical protein
MKIKTGVAYGPSLKARLYHGTSLGRTYRDGDGGGGGGPDDDDVAKERAKAKKAQDEAKNLRTRLKELEAKQADIDAKAEADEKAKAEAEKDWKKLEAKLTKERDDAKAETQQAVKKYNDKVVEVELGQELTAAGVTNPAFHKAALTLVRTSNEIEISDDGKMSVNGNPLNDFVKSWAGSDEGKSFIQNGNGGGGAGPTPQRPGGQQVTGNMGGTAEERKAAIAERFPELNSNQN